MLDVRQLVRDHAFELVLAEHLQDPFGRRHRGVLGIAAGRERVRRRVRNDVDLRHRQAGLLREPLGDLVERMLGPTSCARYIRRTILSENQYEPKFITAAKHERDHQPVRRRRRARR